MPEKVGRKTDLTKELLKEIKLSILDGNNLKETAKKVFETLEEFKEFKEKDKEKGLANFTQKIYNWHSDNYLNLADKIDRWKKDYLISTAQGNIRDDMEMKPKDTQERKLRQDASKFTLETLDKANYSKRTEQTGADGKDLGIIMYPTKQDDKNTLEAT